MYLTNLEDLLSGVCTVFGDNDLVAMPANGRGEVGRGDVVRPQIGEVGLLP